MDRKKAYLVSTHPQISYTPHLSTAMHDLRALLKKYALQNAIFYKGRANPGAVMGKVMAADPELKKRAKEVSALVREIVSEINQLSLEEQKSMLEEVAPELMEKRKKERSSELPELEGAENGVVMRMAPYPSGPLHIGNARMAILNDEYVKRYGGKLFLVYDDTIGSSEKLPDLEAYELIAEGLEWLGIEYHDVFYKSDRMELFYEWAERLIELDGAYVCECSAEELRKNMEQGIECKHRHQSIEENMEKWKKMLAGDYEEGKAILRIKTDMKHPNPAFRDRVLFRISKRAHPRVGNRYHVWPLLEFSWAVDDHSLGMTHVLRGKDLVMEDLMERHLWKTFGIDGPEFIHYGMLRIKEAKLSKSKSSKEVKSGEFAGWDDPRTWSLQSLRRRGIRPEAIRSFILSFGLSQNDIEVPAENLYSENRKLLDAETPRRMFVPDPVKIRVRDPPEMKEVRLQNHPKGNLGERTIGVSDEIYIAGEDFKKLRGKEVRLKDLYNVILNEDADFTSVPNKDIPRIQWVSDPVGVEVVMIDGSVKKGVGERSLLEMKPDDVVQFERFGFVRIDEVRDGTVIAYYAHP
jgi:glutamyl-tRNA synthetase